LAITFNIVSGVDHLGSDLVKSLEVACYSTSPRHQFCTKGPIESANLTIRGFMVHISHTEENYRP
jgi:hypothetical protein